MRDSSCREILVQHIKGIPADKIAIATSGGVDSCSLVVAALDAGKDVSIFSFTFDDFESTDFITARRVADHFDLPFFPVLLPRNREEICSGVKHLINTYGVRGKVQVEVMWPFYFLFREVEKVNITQTLSGLAGDGHFGLSRKDAPGRTSLSEFQQLRKVYFSNPNAGKSRDIGRMATDHGINFQHPYLDPKLFLFFLEKDYQELNKPRQKEGIRKEFPELDDLGVAKHTSLQLGDSRISQRIGAAVISKYAPHAKSPVYVYNRL